MSFQTISFFINLFKMYILLFFYQILVNTQEILSKFLGNYTVVAILSKLNNIINLSKFQ